MPYRAISKLPKSVQKLPVHAKHIYLRAFNNAWEEYSDPAKRKKGSSREVTARKVAWSAVKKTYVKKLDKWVKR